MVLLADVTGLEGALVDDELAMHAVGTGAAASCNELGAVGAVNGADELALVSGGSVGVSASSGRRSTSASVCGSVCFRK